MGKSISLERQKISMQIDQIRNRRNRNEILVISDSLAVRETLALRNREESLRANLENIDIEQVISNQGSAPFKIIHQVTQKMLETGIFPKLEGVGLELGCGSGLFSISMLEHDSEGKIQAIIAVEAAKEYVETMIGRSVQEFLTRNKETVIPALGTFEQLNLDENSLDFILQFEALHHAQDPFIPPIESFRILKPGGYFISVDRSWPDGTTRNAREDLLNHVYEEDWLINKGFPTDKPFSRRDNGEHEYTDSEWISFFKSAGFDLDKIQAITPTPDLKEIVKRVLCIFRLESFLGIKIPARKGLIRAWMLEIVGRNVPLIGNQIITEHPRPLVAFIFRKPPN